MLLDLAATLHRNTQQINIETPFMGFYQGGVSIHGTTPRV